MKRLIRIFLLIVTCVIVLIASFQLILSFPGFQFREELKYRNFTVLSDEKINEEMIRTLEDISSQLITTGFYNENDPVKIVLCNSKNLCSFIDKIAFAPTGAGFHHFSGNIYLFPDRIEKFRRENLKIKGKEGRLLEHTYQNFKFDKVLTHEILHKLHSDSLGILKFKRKMPPPHWKAEGFAEYYTFKPEKVRSKNYNFRDRVHLYLQYKKKFPLFYYRSQLLYEFLTDYKNLDFTEIMEDDMTEQKAYEELINWYNDEKN